ncbi:MAG: helix-turn-helix transcriptional regulator [Cellulosilyticum sp.]|nr:helix-turn-helix transcriptional regulator [Cellulosilyticum sp.]
MSIIIRLDRVMADRKMSLNELAEKVGISNVNLSNFKTGKIKAIRFSTLERICEVLECQPGDLIEYHPSIESHQIEQKGKSQEI